MNQDLARAFRLDGRVAVITGAASGIGRDIAAIFAASGARVVLSDISPGALDEACEAIAARGGDAFGHRADVSRKEEVDALATAAVARFGAIDIWVNAAGVILNRPIEDVTEADLDRILSVNLHGVFWGCAAAGRAMKAQGRGVIVNISSGGGESAVPGLALYSMSKAGVNMLTRTVAKEFGPAGIRANCIAPGWIETPMVAYRFTDEEGRIDEAAREAVLSARAQASPLGITGLPRDISLAALYLASDAGRFVTGQILRPNGGVSMP